MLQNLHMECRNTFQRMNISMGNFQVYDALSMFFEVKKPPAKHHEGFILLPKESDKLQKKFKTFSWKF
jgi:hypothetical protein